VKDALRVLVYHRAAGFVHRSIPDAVEALSGLGDERGFRISPTDDPDRFTSLVGGQDVAVFVHTSGDVLPDPSHRRALEHFVEGGGGFVGVHAASAVGDVRRSWPWYVGLVGASFAGHTVARLYADEPMDVGPGSVHAGSCAEAPEDAEWLGESLAVHSCEPAVVHVEDRTCPAVDGIEDGSRRVDEWYGFHHNPRAAVHVVATVDESTYAPHLGMMGADHPILWWHDVGAGRSVYNSMGHAAVTWRDPSFLSSIAGAVTFSSRRR
jgi:type 1 glutamine amidotransferase